MGSSDKRARDADRNLAIEFVQNAWVGGQLTREEHEQRVEQVLRAATVGDVEREVVDLQGPGGAVWRPTVPPLVPPDQSAVAPAEPDPADMAEADARLVRRARAAIVAAAVVVVGGIVLANAASKGGSFAGDEYVDAAPTVDLVSLASAVEAEFDTAEVYSVTFRDTLVTVVVPRDGAAGRAYEVVWDADLEEWADRTETDAPAEGTLVDLRDVEDVDLGSIEDDAWSSSGDVDEVLVEVRADEVGGEAVCVTTTATDGNGDSSLFYDCDGNQV